MHRDERPNKKNVVPRVYAPASALLAVLLLPVAARAQWTTDASGNISNSNASNVGIGTGAAAPTSKLEVNGTAAVSSDLTVAGGRLKFTLSGPEGQVQGATERLSF